MNFLDLVQKRQSSRAYDARPVSREAIDRCCEAARLSPSACNAQPWNFIIVDDPQKKEALVEQAFSGMFGVFGFVKDAPVLVAVERQASSYAARLGGAFRGIQYGLIDIGIACEHFVLQAAEEGLATCYIGWFNEKGAKKALGISKRKKIDILIALGYADSVKIEEKKRKSLEEIRKYL